MTPNEEAAAGAVEAPAAPSRPRHRRRGEILFVVVVVLLMAGAAFFQEEIGYFFQLQAWDPSKPARTVTSFLKAGQEGRQSETDRYIDVNLFHPLIENGKFVGYQMPITFGRVEYRFNELAKPDNIRPTSSAFVFKGNGAAMVAIPDASGKPIQYRLVMLDGSWKITEIRGGRQRK